MRDPVRRDIVLLGGGHSHVEVLRRFGMRPEPGVRLTLIAREALAPYSGMLPGLIAGHYRHEQAHVDLRPLARFAGARLLHTRASAVDPQRRTVECEARPPVAFDLLSIDVGSRPAADGIAGAREHGVPVKPVDALLARFAGIEARAAAATRPLRVVVVGAGAGGVELALSIEHRFGNRAGPGVEIAIVTDDEAPLPGHAEGVRRRLVRRLGEQRIRLLTSRRAVEIAPDAVVLESGERLACDAAFVVTQAAPVPLLAESGLALDARGFVEIDDCLRSTSHPFVFASGDAATMRSRPLAKSGVYAVRMGPPLAENLRLAARGEPPRPFRPQRRVLALISTGRRHAIASRGSFAVGGEWVWRWKDWIDRRWMRRYQALPEMPPDRDASGELVEMRCGGCGAKVPAEVLGGVLDRVRPAPDARVPVALDAPDDATVIEVPPGEVLVQSVDHFRALLDDPFLFGRIAAVHCLGDLHAMGARPVAALAIATLAHGAPAKQAEELEQLLLGASEALREDGAVLAGGHTAEGRETAFGLSVDGLARRDALLTKGGLAPGDALVLTKALGTGVVFAADMRARAASAAVEAAIASMCRSNAHAASVLAEHGARACTDVTGFGLAGHLLEMLRASGADASIDLDALAPLDGAIDLIERGFRSTAHPGNETAAPAFEGGDAGDPRRALLFDPQTAGGLLAGVPMDRADACVAALRAGGDPHAAVIGAVLARDGAAARVLVSG